MQVDNTIQNKQEIVDSENSGVKEVGCGQNKQLRAENRIARYEQKPQRKASKMLVRLLQWADKLVIKFFTKKLLPNELQIFFNRQARANKVELKKAQIDYSVEDFAVRLYVFWVCQNYFEKANFEQNLNKLLLQLRDQLNRKKKNLQQSFEMCEEQTEKRQKQQELKWMGAIITGLTTFIHKYTSLSSQEQTIQFLIEITNNIMIDCLRKPGNKLSKKKDKLQIKIKYFQQKIAEILGNPGIKTTFQQKQKKTTKLIQKNCIIISPSHFPLQVLTRTNSNSSAFQKYIADDSLSGLRQVQKKQDFQVKLDLSKRSQSLKIEQTNPDNQVLKSCEKITIIKEPIGMTSPTSQMKMQEQVENGQDKIKLQDSDGNSSNSV